MVVRQDSPDRIYKTEEGKLRAIVEEAKTAGKGQPVLVGTVSVSKRTSGQILETCWHQTRGFKRKNHEREAKIVMKAGQKGAVTVATNMAGRGTDIKLEKE